MSTYFFPCIVHHVHMFTLSFSVYLGGQTSVRFTFENDNMESEKRHETLLSLTFL